MYLDVFGYFLLQPFIAADAAAAVLIFVLILKNFN